MEIAYDAALDYANVIAETEKPIEEPSIEKKLGLSQYIKKYSSVEPSDKSKPSKSESSTKKMHSDSDSDSEEDLDIMSNTGNKTCFRCQKLGHVAADCLAPRPVLRSAIAGHTIQNGKRVHFSRAVKYQLDSKGNIEEKVYYMRMRDLNEEEDELYTLGLPVALDYKSDSEESEPADPYTAHPDYDFETDSISPRRY